MQRHCPVTCSDSLQLVEHGKCEITNGELGLRLLSSRKSVGRLAW